MVGGTYLNLGRRGRTRRRTESILALIHGLTWTILLLTTRKCHGKKIVTTTTTPSPSTTVEEVIHPPKIALANATSEYYGDVVFRGRSPLNKLIFQNDSVYIIPNTRNFVAFECIADYPIFWNLAQTHIHPDVYHSVRVMSIRKWKDPFDPETYKYITLITLDGPAPKLTGNYSCQSAARNNIQSSVFIFWESSFGSTFVHSKENLTVAASSSTESIHLPCQVTDPDSQPKLMMLMGQDKKKNSSYQDVHLNESIVYSPPVGYTLKNLANPWGAWKCVLDGDEFVSVRVLQKNESYLAKKLYTFEYDEKSKQVKCCATGAGGLGGSGRRKTPKIYMMDCLHPSTCALREHLFSDSGMVTYIWNQGRRRGNCSIFNMRNYHNGVLRCTGAGFNAYKEFVAPIDIYEPTWNEKRNTTTYFRWEEIDPQKMIAVSSSTRVTDSYWSLSRRHHSSSPDEEDEEVIYSNQTVQLACHTSRYYFASGVHWMLRWKNQTMTRISDEIDSKSFDDLRYYIERERHLNSIGFTAEPEMEAAICFAPVWNSSLWVSKIHYLYVNESMLPTIVEPVELDMVNHTWYANETGRTLSCSASGLPAPTFHWEKDNMTILSSTHNYNVITPNVTEPSVVMTTTTTTTTSTMAPTTTDPATSPASSSNSPEEGDEDESEEEFGENEATPSTDNEGGNNRTRPVGVTTHTSIVISRVSYSTHGVFRCVASNVGGSVSKEFHVTVLEAKSWTVMGMLVGASVITLILIAGIIYLLKRLYQDRQEINRLAVASLSRSSSVNFNHESAVGSNGTGSTRNGGSRGTGYVREEPPSYESAWNTSGGGTGNGIAGDDSNHSITFDNGIMTNNLIDTF